MKNPTYCGLPLSLQSFDKLRLS